MKLGLAFATDDDGWLGENSTAVEPPELLQQHLHLLELPHCSPSIYEEDSNTFQHL